MNIVRDKKIIAYKNRQTKKFAFNLRRLISEAVMYEWSRLGDKQKNKSTVEYINIENKRNDLYKTLDASICLCPGCNQTDKDMYYNATAEVWFCTQCVQEYRDFYIKEFSKNEKDLFYESFL